MRSRSPRRGRSRSRSFSRSRSYRLVSPQKPIFQNFFWFILTTSPLVFVVNSRSRSPARRGRDVDYEERRSRSPGGRSPKPNRRTSPSKSRKRSPTPDDIIERGSPSPSEVPMDRVGYSVSPKQTSRSPAGKRYEDESPYAGNGQNRSPSPREDRSPVGDYNDVVSPARSPSPREGRSPPGVADDNNVGYPRSSESS